jgi:hypothetical protein
VPWDRAPRHSPDVLGATRRGFPHHVLPHHSDPPPPQVLANLAGTRLQTGRDRSLRRGLNHAVPAATLPAARCFRGGVTPRGRSLSQLILPPRQVPSQYTASALPKQHRPKRRRLLCPSGRATSTSSETIFSKGNHSKTNLLLRYSLFCFVTQRMLVEQRRPHTHRGGSLKSRKFIDLSSGIY